MKQAPVGPGRSRGKLLPGVGAGKGPRTAQGRKTKDEGEKVPDRESSGHSGESEAPPVGGS